MNNIELKIVDKDGSNFGKKITFPGVPEQWKAVTISVSELTYWWGGDKELDIKNIKAIWFGISREKGQKGMLLVNDLQLSQ